MFSLHKGDRKPEVSVTITTETYVRLALLTVATIVLLISVQKAAHALLLIFIACFLALALNAPVHWLSERLPGKRKGNRVLATSLSFLIVVVVLLAFLASLVPPLVRQTNNFIQAAPGLVRDFRSQDSATGRLIRQYNLEAQVDKVSGQLSERLDNIGGAAFSTFQRIGNSFFALLSILVLTFMMLVEGPRWIGFYREILPDRHRPRSDHLMRDMYRVVKGYVNGQVTLAFLAAIFIMPVILLLDISYPAALVVVVFICGLIPMVGHTIGAIIVSLVALFQSVPAALIILGYYILYQQIENILIQPKIQANATNMSPLLVFVSVIIGVSFSGLIGGLLAIPIAGCLRILILDYLRHKKIISKPDYHEATQPDTI